MNASKVIKGVVGGGRYTVTAPKPEEVVEEQLS